MDSNQAIRTRVTGQRPRPEATVLVVDDDETLADTFALWLEDVVDVRTAYSAATALDVFEGATVDAALLDRRMPATSGDELLATLRERGHDCPVAMLSAVEPDTDVVDMAFDDYLCKPVDRETLLGTVSHLLAIATQPPAVRKHLSLEAKLAMLEARAEDAAVDDPDALDALRERVARARERATAAHERDRFDDDDDDAVHTGAC